MNVNSKVESSSNLHYNRAESPSKEEVLVENEGLNRGNSQDFYIPKNLDIDTLLENHPLNIPNARSKLIYILHLINYIPSTRKDYDIEGNNGFTPLNRKMLQSVVHDYRKCIDYLITHKVIIESNHYIPSEKSKGIKFTSKYNKKVTPIKVYNKSLINGISKKRVYDKETTDKLSYLSKWFNDKLEVDFEPGVKYLMDEYIKEVNNPTINNPELKLNSRLLPFQRLKRGDFAFFVDKTAGRLHTNLTQIKSELRKYISYNGQKLVSIDIINCQPYLSTALLDDKIYTNSNMNNIYNNTHPNPIMLVNLINSIKNEKDVIFFRNIVSEGRFYEEYGNLITNNHMDIGNSRELAKESAFNTLFSANQSIAFKPELRYFKNAFPNVYKVYSSIKSKKHSILAIILQKLEAELVLHQACRIISENRPDIPLFTLHDSIITTENNVGYVKRVFKNVLKEKLGKEPKFKIEKW
ncbi:hypothetical protein [Pontimicrobium sp. IMCC45349]|uniref:hypothetical protein n=1 Tax=Pontimicrobium sp. IMCC45349 TaxID=3391574 RepID=UPI0039A1FCBD